MLLIGLGLLILDKVFEMACDEGCCKSPLWCLRPAEASGYCTRLFLITRKGNNENSLTQMEFAGQAWEYYVLQSSCTASPTPPPFPHCLRSCIVLLLYMYLVLCARRYWLLRAWAMCQWNMSGRTYWIHLPVCVGVYWIELSNRFVWRIF